MQAWFIDVYLYLGGCEEFNERLFQSWEMYTTLNNLAIQKREKDSLLSLTILNQPFCRCLTAINNIQKDLSQIEFGMSAFGLESLTSKGIFRLLPRGVSGLVCGIASSEHERGEKSRLYLTAI